MHPHWRVLRPWLKAWLELAPEAERRLIPCLYTDHLRLLRQPCRRLQDELVVKNDKYVELATDFCKHQYRRLRSFFTRTDKRVLKFFVDLQTDVRSIDLIKTEQLLKEGERKKELVKLLPERPKAHHPDSKEVEHRTRLEQFVRQIVGRRQEVVQP